MAENNPESDSNGRRTRTKVSHLHSVPRHLNSSCWLSSVHPQHSDRH